MFAACLYEGNLRSFFFFLIKEKKLPYYCQVSEDILQHVQAQAKSYRLRDNREVMLCCSWVYGLYPGGFQQVFQDLKGRYLRTPQKLCCGHCKWEGHEHRNIFSWPVLWLLSNHCRLLRPKGFVDMIHLESMHSLLFCESLISWLGQVADFSKL